MHNRQYSNCLNTFELESNSNELIMHVDRYIFPERIKQDSVKIRVEANLVDDYHLEAPEDYNEEIGEYEERLYSWEKNNIKTILNPTNHSEIVIYNNKITITSNNLSGLFMDTYRILRQLMIWDLLNAGGVILHASGVIRDGKATLYVGEKGAGKTTALFQELLDRSERKSMLSNDRVILFVKNGILTAFGWQAVAHVGIGTIYGTVGFNKLHNIHDKAGGTAYLLTQHNLLSESFINELSNKSEYEIRNFKEKIMLMPWEIAELTGTEIREGYGEMDKIICPILQLKDEGQNSNIETSLIIEQSFISIDDLPFYTNWLSLKQDFDYAQSIRYVQNAMNQIETKCIVGEKLIPSINT